MSSTVQFCVLWEVFLEDTFLEVELQNSCLLCITLPHWPNSRHTSLQTQAPTVSLLHSHPLPAFIYTLPLAGLTGGSWFHRPLILCPGDLATQKEARISVINTKQAFKMSSEKEATEKWWIRKWIFWGHEVDKTSSQSPHQFSVLTPHLLALNAHGWVGRISKYFGRFSFLTNSSFIRQLVPGEADGLVQTVGDTRL